jgi:hypothetical protein
VTSNLASLAYSMNLVRSADSDVSVDTREPEIAASSLLAISCNLGIYPSDNEVC